MSEEIIKRRTRTADQAYVALARLCARAEKSSGDARRLMRTWGVPESEREGVLQRLLRERFIDDSRYASAFVRDKIALSGWGPYKIRTALAAKGVAREVIDEALGECDRTKMDSRLEQMLQRKLGSLREGTPYERRAKLMRYGLSLGYDYSTVADRVEELIKEID